MDTKRQSRLKDLASLVRLHVGDHKLSHLKQRTYKAKGIAKINKHNLFKERHIETSTLGSAEFKLSETRSNNIIYKEEDDLEECKTTTTDNTDGKRLLLQNKCSSSRQANRHHHKRAFRCGECLYFTDRKNNLKRHINTMHESCSKVLECCHMVFENKAALREHVSQRHRQGYLCDECGRNFCRKALLKRHVTVHSGQKDHVCEVCGYATSHKSNLDRHTRRHRSKGVDGIAVEDTETWQSHVDRAAKNGFRDSSKHTWNIPKGNGLLFLNVVDGILPDDTRTWNQRYVERITQIGLSESIKNGWNLKGNGMLSLQKENTRSLQDQIWNIDNIALSLQDKYSKYLDGRICKSNTNTFAPDRLLGDSRCHAKDMVCSPLALLYDGQDITNPDDHRPDISCSSYKPANYNNNNQLDTEGSTVKDSVQYNKEQNLEPSSKGRLYGLIGGCERQHKLLDDSHAGYMRSNDEATLESDSDDPTREINTLGMDNEMVLTPGFTPCKEQELSSPCNTKAVPEGLNVDPICEDQLEKYYRWKPQAKESNHKGPNATYKQGFTWKKTLYPYRHRCDHTTCQQSFWNQLDWHMHTHSLGFKAHVQYPRPPPQRPLSLHMRTLLSVNNYRKTIAAYL